MRFESSGIHHLSTTYRNPLKYRGFGLFLPKNSGKKAVFMPLKVHNAKIIVYRVWVIVYKVSLIVYRVWVIVYIVPHIVAEYKIKRCTEYG